MSQGPNPGLLSFQIGAFLGPVIAIPFLGKDGNENNANLTQNTLNVTSLDSDYRASQITTLYPLMGLCLILMSSGFLLMAIQNCSKTVSKDSNTSDEKTSETNEHKMR